MFRRATNASLVASALLLSACTTSDAEGQQEVIEDAATTAANDPSPGTSDAGAPAAQITMGFGVSDDVIRIGLNVDLSGPSASLVSEVVEGQTVYWDVLNADGGIAGRQVEMVILDSGSMLETGIENFATLAQTSDDGVVMISENTGSAITAAIAADAASLGLAVIPGSWASQWSDPELGSSLIEQGSNYCVQSINGVSFLHDRVQAAGVDPKLAIVSRSSAYGQDGHAGAALAADALGIDVVYAFNGQVTGESSTVMTRELVNSGANMVWLALNSEETADVFGGAVNQGMEAEWSGNQPSYHHSLLVGDLGPAFGEYYWHSTFSMPWNAEPSDGMSEVLAAFEEHRPDNQIADGYVAGWVEGMIVETILRHAAADGDMTRAGVLRAVHEVTVDFKGLSPNQRWSPDPNESIVRETYIFGLDIGARDIQPVHTGVGGTGLVLEAGPYVSATAADFVVDGPCAMITS